MVNKHTHTLVPVGTWLYHSPKLAMNGVSIDIGLVCESLLYYDQVYIVVHDEKHFNAIIAWFKQQGAFQSLLSLIDDGVINFVYHSFIPLPIYKEETNGWEIWNINDMESQGENVFNKRVLYNDGLAQITQSKERKKLYSRLGNGAVSEFKADQFVDAIENTRADSSDPSKTGIIIQSFVDELYEEFQLKKQFHVVSSLERINDQTILKWNVNFDQMNLVTKHKLGIHLGMPLAGLAQCNRLIKTSSLLNCDLYLGPVMDSLVNNKLLEIDVKSTKIASVIQEFNVEVDFPRISNLVNKGVLSFQEILKIRKEARKFRDWLQEQGERDSNALIAYQSEVANKTGLAKFGGGLLSITGVAIVGALGAFGGSLGASLDPSVGGVVGSAIASVAGLGVDKFIGSFNKEWKPMVFGNWLTKYTVNKQK